MTRLITVRETLDRISISKSNLYRLLSAGEFPPRVRLGTKRIAFVEQEVENWISTQVEEGRTNV